MINVTQPFPGNKAKLQSYIDQIYASGCFTNHGPLTRQLEQRLKEYLGVRNIVLTSNGTLALQIAYRALGIQGSAITTPFSFIATSSTLQWEHIRPVFSDIDPVTWNLDPSQIEARLQKDTSAIVATHVFGNPCDVERIQAIADRNGLKTIYDGAHAFGVRYKGESIANWGDICTLSFHATKVFHTIEGGAIVTNDDDLAQRARELANFGFSEGNRLSGPGINAKLNEFSAAMGLCVLDDIDQILEERAEIGHRYELALAGYLDLQHQQPGSERNYSYFPIALQEESELLRVAGQLNERQINPRRYFYPSLDTVEYLQPQQPQWISRGLSRRVLCLPIFPGLTWESQRTVIETVLREVEARQLVRSQRETSGPYQDAFTFNTMSALPLSNMCKKFTL